MPGWPHAPGIDPHGIPQREEEFDAQGGEVRGDFSGGIAGDFRQHRSWQPGLCPERRGEDVGPAVPGVAAKTARRTGLPGAGPETPGEYRTALARGGKTAAGRGKAAARSGPAIAGTPEIACAPAQGRGRL